MLYKTQDNISGFTLIEVLVSLALSAAILAAVYVSFFAAERASGIAGSAVRMSYQSRMVLDRISSELASAVYKKDDTHTLPPENVVTRFLIKDRELFGKKVSSIRFASMASPLGLRGIEYRIDGGHLQRREWDPYKTPDPLPGEPWLTLMSGIASFTLEARRSDKWVQTWDSDMIGETPVEIRITLVAGDESGSETVTAISRPRIDRTL